MALRDQPYLPLFVQDFLTDEKLNECSALACGIYIKLMCLMHKSEDYGVILLRQKDKQSDNQIKNFATKLLRHLPYPVEDIINGLVELTNEGCLQIEGDKLLQKRMIRDNEISIIRKKAGEKGAFAKAKGLANPQANTEYEYEVVNENVNVILKEGGNGKGGLQKVERPEGSEPDKITKLFITCWQRNPKNYSEVLAVEKMLLDYTEKHIIQAFRKAAEMDKMTVAYVRGILKNHYEELAKTKAKQEAEAKKIITKEIISQKELIQPGQLTGLFEDKFKMFDDKPKSTIPEIDKNSLEYKRKLSLMNQQILKEKEK